MSPLTPDPASGHQQPRGHSQPFLWEHRVKGTALVLRTGTEAVPTQAVSCGSDKMQGGKAGPASVPLVSSRVSVSEDGTGVLGDYTCRVQGRGPAQLGGSNVTWSQGYRPSNPDF